MTEDSDAARLEQAVDQLFERVWTAALGRSLRAPDRSDHLPSRSRVLEVAIGIRGDTPVELRLFCPRETAREFAAALHRRPVTKITEQQLQDCLLHVASLFGGDLAALLPGHNEMRPPSEVKSHIAPLGTPPCKGREFSFRGWPCQLAVAPGRDSGSAR